MSKIVVSTKEEFKTAVKNKANEIILTGDALKYYKVIKRLKTGTKWGIPLIVGSVLLIPLTGGGSAVLGALGTAKSVGQVGLVAAAATTAATEVGLSTAAIITFISFMGASLLYAIFSKYSEVEMNGMGFGLKLKK